MEGIFVLIVLVFGFPIGYLIAYLTRDELLIGRRYFIVLMCLSLFFAVFFYIMSFNASLYGSLFVLILSLIGYWKSFDKKWTKRRI